MKYKGIELKEITEPQLFNPPRRMLVWDSDGDTVELNVCAIVNRESFRVITERSSWRHCAEIPEVLATNRELAQMTDIVKHGNLYTTFECKFCGCFFRTACITESKDLYNREYRSSNCPECGREATTYNKGE